MRESVCVRKREREREKERDNENWSERGSRCVVYTGCVCGELNVERLFIIQSLGSSSDKQLGKKSETKNIIICETLSSS